MLEQPKRRSTLDILLNIIVALVILGAMVPASYYTVFRWADAAICIPRAASRIGVAPNRDAITNYLDERLTPGMFRGDAINILKTVGPIDSNGRSSLNVDESASEVFTIHICMHPMNNISVTLTYSRDAKYLSGFFYGAP